MNPTQKLVADFVRSQGLETDVAHRVLDAVSELGEVAKEVLKGTSYGSARFAPQSGWTDEVGDVFFSLLCLANTTGVDVDAAVQRALEKYRRRLDATGDAGSNARRKRARSKQRRRRSTTGL